MARDREVSVPLTGLLREWSFGRTDVKSVASALFSNIAGYTLAGTAAGLVTIQTVSAVDPSLVARHMGFASLYVLGLGLVGNVSGNMAGFQAGGRHVLLERQLLPLCVYETALAHGRAAVAELDDAERAAEEGDGDGDAGQPRVPLGKTQNEVGSGAMLRVRTVLDGLEGLPANVCRITITSAVAEVREALLVAGEVVHRDMPAAARSAAANADADDEEGRDRYLQRVAREAADAAEADLAARMDATKAGRRYKALSALLVMSSVMLLLAKFSDAGVAPPPPPSPEGEELPPPPQQQQQQPPPVARV